MKKVKRIVDCCVCSLALMLAALCFCSAKQKEQPELTERKYELLWEDNFDRGKLDTTKWSKINRVKDVAWVKYMSPDERLYEFRGSYLRLYARANDGIAPNDTAPFLTAGISTRHKATVKYGKIEVRARIRGAQGCWPAIWTSADDPALCKYPMRPEIDIAEHYNYNDFVVQTIHSNYTDKLKRTKDPIADCRPAIRNNKFNTYTAEILPDRIILSINGKETFTYPRIDVNPDLWQYPFCVDQYLMIDMQVGNAYLKVDKKTYPAYMDIDWVRMYKLAE